MKTDIYTTLCILQKEYSNNKVVYFKGKYYLI